MSFDCRALDLDGAANFEQLLEVSPACTFILDLQGRIRYANAYARDVCGAHCGARAEGARFDRIWAEDRRRGVATARSRAARGEVQRVKALPDAGGDKYWDLILAPLRSPSGETNSVLATSRDVTALVQARVEAERKELAFKRKAAALRSAGLLAKLGGWEIDFANGAVDWSEEIWTLLRGEAEPLSMTQAMAIYSEEDQKRISDLIADARRTGQSLSFVVQATRLDGSRIWVSILGEPEFENGVCTAFRGVAQDITEAKEANDRLAQTERRLRLATEIADLHVYELDFASRTLTSQGAENTFYEGPLTFEQLNRDPYHGIDPRDLAGAKAGFEAAQAEGRPFALEYRVQRSDGQEVWAYSTGQLERDAAGRPVRLVGAMQNITERKRAEQALVAARDAAEAANQAKTAFLANMSHEIRTPLNAVLGMAQAMARDDLPEVQRSRLEVIQSAGEALLHLLNDVLDLSRIEAGRIQLEDGEIDLPEIVRSAEATFSALACEKDLTLAFRVAPEAWGPRRGDPLRIRQILYNLIGNAVKFTTAGSVTVDVAALGDEVVMTVADTGPGIPSHRLPTLFEKFVQVDNSTTRNHGGSGLGLAISQELAQLMGGTISVESAAGVGSTFTVRLPLNAMAGRPRRAAVEPEPETVAAPAPGLRVLAAEDNPMNQLVLRTLMSQLGVEPVIVGNGAEALEAWASAPWDVVLLDVHMPVMDGLAAARAIREREREAGLPRTPVLALTANAMSHQAAECLASGMDGVVPKPIEVERLVLAIEQVLAAGAERLSA